MPSLESGRRRMDRCAFARQVGELGKQSFLDLVRGRALLRPHAWDCSASGTSRRPPRSSIFKTAPAAGTEQSTLKGSPTMLSTTSTPRAASSPESEGEYFKKRNWKHKDVKQRHGLHGYDQCINQIVATRLHHRSIMTSTPST